MAMMRETVMRWTRQRWPAFRVTLAAFAGFALAWLAWRVVRLCAGSPLDGANREALLAAEWARGTRVFAHDGTVLGERAAVSGLAGRATRLEDITSRLVSATLASEDRRFYRHDGIDRSAVVRALWLNVTRRRVVSGGSTVTMQLVKRMDYRGEAHRRSFVEKVAQAARAQNLEAQLTKTQILEAYFRHLDYGHGYAGPEAAAQGYFGVSARDLSWGQATFLAVLPRAPSALDPYRHKDRGLRRQRALIEQLRRDGVLSSDDAARALAEDITLMPRKRPMQAPHLLLAAAHKHEGDVWTTLDAALQRDVEQLAAHHASTIRALGAYNLAVVVVDNSTGHVLAEVGGARYSNAASGAAIDFVRQRRQPGSTLKPFVYARAFEGVISPVAPLPDVPTQHGATGARYAPENFDGTFQGPIPAREALAGSLNVPAVRLAAALGSADLHALLGSLGVHLPHPASHYGLSLALGSAEVSPLELAQAYVVLARGGESVPVTDRVCRESAASSGCSAALPRRLLQAAAVAEVTEALADPLARVRGLRSRGALEFPFPVAFKTGTSSAYRDGWTAGYTRERTVIVWVGNADATPTQKLTGGQGAGPLFIEVMTRAMRDVAQRKPLYDPGLIDDVEVCPLSGQRVGAACGAGVTRKLARAHVPATTCAMHVHARRVAPNRWACDPQAASRIVVLPDEYGRFLRERPPGAPGLDPLSLPWFLRSEVDGCPALNDPHGAAPMRLDVLEPVHEAVYRAHGTSGEVPVAVDVRGAPRDVRFEVLVDGAVVTELDASGRATVPAVLGDHVLEVRPVLDSASGQASRLLAGHVTFRVN